MMFENLIFSLADGIATITINRPAARNALNSATIRELGALLTHLEGLADLRGVIVTGEGPKAFVAGADIAEMTMLSPEQAEEFSALGNATFRRLEQLPVPVIAAVNGFALGGGCELALSCDLIYASANAQFGQPEVNLGLMPGFGGTQRLVRRVGWGRAMYLLLTGNTINAQAAQDAGLVDEVTEPDELMNIAHATLATISKRGPLAVAATKRLMQHAADVSLDEGLSAESKAFGALFATADAREGTAAFLGKRPAQFVGR